MGEQAAFHSHPRTSHLHVSGFSLSPSWSGQHAPTTTVGAKIEPRQKLIHNWDE